MKDIKFIDFAYLIIILTVLTLQITMYPIYKAYYSTALWQSKYSIFW